MLTGGAVLVTGCACIECRTGLQEQHRLYDGSDERVVKQHSNVVDC